MVRDAIAYDPANGFLYVADFTNEGHVDVISPSNGTVVANVSVGSVPDGVAYDTVNGCMYVSNEDSNTISVILPSLTVSVTIRVSGIPTAIASDPVNGHVYITTFASTNVTVLGNFSVLKGGIISNTQSFSNAEIAAAFGGLATVSVILVASVFWRRP